MAASLPLRFREPLTRWMLSAALAAVVLHGLVWFAARSLFGDDQALAEAQRQMILALGWMIGALILWKLTPPASRLHAFVATLGCVLFVAGIGTLFKFLTYLVSGFTFNREFLVSFGMLGGVVFLAQIAAAVPSAILLQAVALTRRPPADSSSGPDAAPDAAA